MWATTQLHEEHHIKNYNVSSLWTLVVIYVYRNKLKLILKNYSSKAVTNVSVLTNFIKENYWVIRNRRPNLVACLTNCHGVAIICSHAWRYGPIAYLFEAWLTLLASDDPWSLLGRGEAPGGRPSSCNRTNLTIILALGNLVGRLTALHLLKRLFMRWENDCKMNLKETNILWFINYNFHFIFKSLQVKI